MQVSCGSFLGENYTTGGTQAFPQGTSIFDFQLPTGLLAGKCQANDY